MTSKGTGRSGNTGRQHFKFFAEMFSLGVESCCDNDVVAKTSTRNVGDFVVFLESRKSLAIIIQNNCVKLVAHKQ